MEFIGFGTIILIWIYMTYRNVMAEFNKQHEIIVDEFNRQNGRLKKVIAKLESIEKLCREKVSE